MVQNKKIFLFSLLVLMSLFSFIFLPSLSEARMMRNIINVDPEIYSQQLQSKFEYWSQISGIDINKIKNYWAQGKTFREMSVLEKVDLNKVQEKNREYRLSQLRTNLQELVNKGIITQEQANQRLEFYRKKLETGYGFYGRGNFGWKRR